MASLGGVWGNYWLCRSALATKVVDPGSALAASRLASGARPLEPTGRQLMQALMAAPDWWQWSLSEGPAQEHTVSWHGFNVGESLKPSQKGQQRPTMTNKGR